jgi:hypothetical protein
MRKFLSVISFVLCLPVLVSAVGSQWVALKLNGQIIGSGAIEEYVENLYLTDVMKIALFSLAQGNFDKYQVEKQQWIQRNFEKGLKTFAYLSIIQGLAGSQFFPADPSKIVHDKENEVLKNYLQKGSGIQRARIQFAESLMKDGYPHKVQQDPEELYWDWYNGELKRVTEQLRIQAVMDWTRFRAMKEMQKSDTFEIPAFLEKTQKEIALAFADPVYKSQIIKSIFAKNPHFHALIKNVELLDSSSVVLSDLIRLAPQMNSALAQVLSQQFANGFSEKIANWEQLVTNYAKNHSAEELRQSARLALDEFFSQGDERQFILSRLSILAAILVENSSENQVRGNLNALVASSMQKLAQELSTPAAFIEKHGNENIESAVVSSFRSHFTLQSAESAYLKEFSDFLASAVRLQVKRFVGTHQSPAQIQYHDKKDPQFYTRVMKLIDLTKIRQSLRTLHAEEFEWRADVVGLEVSPRAGETLSKQGAWKYSLDNQVYKELSEESL